MNNLTDQEKTVLHSTLRDEFDKDETKLNKSLILIEILTKCEVQKGLIDEMISDTQFKFNLGPF